MIRWFDKKLKLKANFGPKDFADFLEYHHEQTGQCINYCTVIKQYSHFSY